LDWAAVDSKLTPSKNFHNSGKRKGDYSPGPVLVGGGSLPAVDTGSSSFQPPALSQSHALGLSPSRLVGSGYIDEHSLEDYDKGDYDADEAFGETEPGDVLEDIDIPSGTESQGDEFEATFTELMHEENDHYFVHCYASNPDANKIGGLENEHESGTTSLTNFLTLPPIVVQVSNQK
jgi:hypothetical protein